jgi:DNA polymerase-3 subunit gamma/tau
VLLEKLYDRDYELGEVFDRNIRYRSFDGKELTWESTAEGNEKKLLVKYWGIIRMFVQEIFGFETKIVNIAKEKTPQSGETNTEDKKKAPETPITSTPPGTEPSFPESRTDDCSLPENAVTSGTMEAVEMPSSCMDPDPGTTEACKEKDPSTLLEEPMIKEAIALFDPKRVRIKRKS